MQNEGFFAFLAARMMPYKSSSSDAPAFRFALGEIATHGNPVPANSGLIYSHHQILGSVFRFDYITGLSRFC